MLGNIIMHTNSIYEGVMCNYDNCEYEAKLPGNLKQQRDLIYEGIQWITVTNENI